MNGKVVLVSNGPGELTTWVRPVLAQLRRSQPDLPVVISLIPCQFASGAESRVASSFGADAVTSPGQYLRLAGGGGLPDALGGEVGAVLSLGGNTRMAVRIAERVDAPVYRYSFVPYWHPRLRTLFVHDDRAYRKARMLGAPPSRLENIGNLVADALGETAPLQEKGDPHILLLAGSRDAFAIHLIPFMLGLAQELMAAYPNARLVWPVSRLLSDEVIEAGLRGEMKDTLGGTSGERQGSVIVTSGGARVEMIPEEERYAHMASTDLAVTIPGTNTLELGIAGVPSVVVLPLNKPEIIPLEGPGHWLSLLPLVGTPLKRRAVRLFVEGRSYPVSLPNQRAGEELMVEITGRIDPASVARAAGELLDDESRLAAIRARLNETMPGPGAAQRIVSRMTEGG